MDLILEDFLGQLDVIIDELEEQGPLSSTAELIQKRIKRVFAAIDRSKDHTFRVGNLTDVFRCNDSARNAKRS